LGEKKHGLDLTQGRINTLLIRFAVPFVLANMVNALHGVVGTIIVGQFADFQTLAGVGVGTQALNLTFPFVMGLGTAGTVIIGRYIGEKNAEASTKATGSIFITTIAIITAVTLLVLLIREPLLDFLNTQPDMRESASRFVIIGLIGVPFNIGFSMLSAVFRGIGNSKVPSVIAAISAGGNIAMAILLAGVIGVAADISVVVAMVSAQFISFVLIAVWLYIKKLPYPFSLKKNMRADKDSMRYIGKVGGPLVLTDFLMMVSFMIVTRQINGMGTLASAAVSLVNRAFPLMFTMPMGISVAVSAMTAQNLGAGSRLRAVASLRWGTIYALGLSVIFFVMCLTIPELLLSVFTDDYSVISGAANYIRPFSIDLLFMAFVFTMNAYFVGSGRSRIQMVHTLIASLVVRVPLSMFVAGLEGLELNTQLGYLGFTVSISGVVSLVICIWYFVRMNKKDKAEEAARLSA